VEGLSKSKQFLEQLHKLQSFNSSSLIYYIAAEFAELHLGKSLLVLGHECR